MNIRASKASPQIMLGQVGVHRVAAELLLRGMVPYFPSVDVGVDLVVNGVLKIQVKSTRHAKANGWDKRHFVFSLKRAEYVRGKQYVPYATRQFSAECDFVVCHAVEANRFWIIPAAELDGLTAVVCSGENRAQWKAFDVEKARVMREAGHSFKSIGEEFGLSWSTIQRRLANETPKRAYTDLFKYEDRWDLLAGTLALLTESPTVNEKVTSSVKV